METENNNAGIKYEIVKELYTKMNVIRSRIFYDLNSSESCANERGVALSLLNKAGIKAVWNSADGTAGNRSIMVKDVDLVQEELKYFVTLNILGSNKIPISNKIKEIISRLKENKEDDDDLFTEISEEKVNEYLKTLNDKFTMEIFQIYFACKTMEVKLWSMKVTDKVEVIAKFNEVVQTFVLSIKNWTLRDYIDPAIIYSFCKRKGISINDICDWDVCEEFEYAKETPADFKAFPKNENRLIVDFETVKLFHEHIKDIRQRIDDDLKSEKECENERGIILYLLDKVGIRYVTGNDEEREECGSLKVKNVKLYQEEERYFVLLIYIGTIAISEQVFKIITKLKGTKSDEDYLITVNSRENVESYLKSLNDKFNMNVFTTYLACISLARNLWSVESNEKWEVITKFYEYIYIVAALLNHKKMESIHKLKISVTNPATTLKCFIDPAIIQSFCSLKGIKLDEIYHFDLCDDFPYAEDNTKGLNVFADQFNNEDYLFKISENENEGTIQTDENITRKDKYTIVKEFHNKRDIIRQRIKNDLKRPDPFKNERGIVLFLLKKTGINVVSSSGPLKVKDVQLKREDTNYFITLNIIETNKILITEKIKNIINRLKENKQDGDDLFTEITEDKVNEYLKILNDNFTVEIFQSCFVNKFMEDRLSSIKVNDKLDAITHFNKVINIVATFMNKNKKVIINDLEINVPNTKSILREYIDPAIIHAYCKLYGIKINDICDLELCQEFEYAKNTPTYFKAFHIKKNEIEEKYETVKEFHKCIKDIRHGIDEDLQSVDKCENERGVILFLLDNSGIMSMWKSSESTPKNCSLIVKDINLEVEQQNNYVTLNIFGKNKIRISEKLNQIITYLKENKQDGDHLFTEITEEKVNEYLKTFNEKFTMKIFQTYFACKMIEDMLWSMKVNDKTEVIAKFNEIVNIVATIMDVKKKIDFNHFEIYVPNTTLTLRKYIDPSIIHSFCKRKGIKISTICKDYLCKSFEYANHYPHYQKVFSEEYNDGAYLYEVSDGLQQTDENNTSTEKYEIVKEFRKKNGNIRQRIDDDLESPHRWENERGIILFLLNKSGINAVSKTHNGTSKNCSLKVQDAKLELDVSKYFVTFNIMSQNKIPISNKINEIISRLKENKQDGDDLFTEITEEKVNKYLKTLNDKFTMDHFQTYFVCKTMKDKLWSKKVNDKVKAIAKFNRVVNLVATIMDNKMKMIFNGLEIYVPNTKSTLHHCVDPTIFYSFCKENEITIDEILDSNMCKDFEYVKDATANFKPFLTNKHNYKKSKDNKSEHIVKEEHKDQVNINSRNKTQMKIERKFENKNRITSAGANKSKENKFQTFE